MGLKRGAIRICCVISCMNWNNSSNAGVWSVNFNNNRTNSNNNAGGRADYGFTSRPTQGKWNCRDMVSCFVRTMIAPFFLVGNIPNVRRAA